MSEPRARGLIQRYAESHTVVVVGCSPLGNAMVDTIAELSPAWDLAGVIWLAEPAATTKDAWVSFRPKMVDRVPVVVKHVEAIHDSDIWQVMREHVISDIISDQIIEDDNPIIQREVISDILTDEANRDSRILRPEVILQCWWSGIFPESALSQAKKYCLGIHPTPLRFGVGRGAAALNWTVIELHEMQLTEMPTWENSLFVMQRTPDTGAIVDHEEFSIAYRDTISTLLDKVNYTSRNMVRRTLQSIAEGNENFIAAPTGRVVAHTRRSREDGLMALNWSASKAIGYIRALTHPYSGAYFPVVQTTSYYRHRRRGGMTVEKDEQYENSLIVWDADLVCDTRANHKIAGNVVLISSEGVLVRMADDCILMKRVGFKGCEFWADEFAKMAGWGVGRSLSIPAGHALTH